MDVVVAALSPKNEERPEGEGESK